MKDFVELEKGSIQRKDEDVIITTYKAGAIVDLIDAKEIDRIYITMAEGQEIFSLVDLTAENSDLTNEAQAFFSRRAFIVPHVKGAAIVISGVRSRIVARFYIQYFKPLYPTKICSSIEEALNWFDSVRKEELVG